MASPTLDAFRERLRSYRDDPVGFARDVLDFDPHAGQVAWLENSTLPENAITTGNRWGKSSIAAVKLIWKCAYFVNWTKAVHAAMMRKHEPYMCWNLSHSAQQSKIVWRKAHSLL